MHKAWYGVVWKSMTWMAIDRYDTIIPLYILGRWTICWLFSTSSILHYMLTLEHKAHITHYAYNYCCALRFAPCLAGILEQQPKLHTLCPVCLCNIWPFDKDTATHAVGHASSCSVRTQLAGLLELCTVHGICLATKMIASKFRITGSACWPGQYWCGLIIHPGTERVLRMSEIRVREYYMRVCLCVRALYVCWLYFVCSPSEVFMYMYVYIVYIGGNVFAYENVHVFTQIQCNLSWTKHFASTLLGTNS